MKPARTSLRIAAALAIATALSSAPRAPAMAGVSVAGLTVEPRVLSALRAASETSGVALPYLLAKAYRESGFDVRADAASSSAAGIFQFTRQTWLDLFQRHGARYGQAALADRIVRVRGVLAVPDGGERRRILGLRHDPDLAAHLAAEYTRENRELLERALRRRVTPEELYIAHFLGPQGALQLLRAARATPDLAAAEVFPDAAASNPSLFTPQGEAVSVAVLHHGLVRAFRRELVRFTGIGPVFAPILPPRKPRAPDAATLAAALADGVLPAGGFALPWIHTRLDGGEPVRAGLGVAASAALLRDALAPEAAAPRLAQTPPLPESAARAARLGVETSYALVAADRAEGEMPSLRGPRFAAEMPPPPPEGARVAGGAMPRYEESTDAPELADATARAARPGV